MNASFKRQKETFRKYSIAFIKPMQLCDTTVVNFPITNEKDLP